MTPQVIKRPIRDISEGLLSGIKISPPIQALKFVKDIKNKTRVAQNPKAELLHAYKALRGAGYASPGPAMGGVAGGVSKMVSNVGKKRQLMSGMDEAVANGMSAGSVLATLSPLGTILKARVPVKAKPLKTTGEFGQTMKRDLRFKSPW